MCFDYLLILVFDNVCAEIKFFDSELRLLSDVRNNYIELMFFFALYFTSIDITVEIQGELPITVDEETVVPGVGTFKQLKVTESDTIIMTCRTTATVTESVLWTHDNTPISYNSHKVTTNENVSTGKSKKSNK